MPLLRFQMRAGSIPLPASLSSPGWGVPPRAPLSPSSPPPAPLAPSKGSTVMLHPDLSPTPLPALSPALGPTAASLLRPWQTLSLGPAAPLRESQRNFHHRSPLLVCIRSQSESTSRGCLAMSGSVPTLPVPGLCPWNCHVPALPGGVCRETCLDGTEQITREPQWGGLVLD